MADQAHDWFTALTALGGVLVGWLTEFIRDHFARRRDREGTEAARLREREARNATRREQRFERRTKFQRETLIELQEILQRLLRANGRAVFLDRKALRAGGEWGKQLLPDDLDAEISATNVRSMLLAARVRDDEIRKLTEELRDKCGSVLFSKGEAEAMGVMVEASDMFGSLNERIGKQIRQLDDDEDSQSQKPMDAA